MAAGAATSFNVNQADLDRLGRAIDETMTTSRRDTKATVKAIARTYASRARMVTPQVPRGARVGTMTHMIRVVHSGGRRYARRAEPFEVGMAAWRGRGYARAGWLGVLARLGARVSGRAGAVQRAVLTEAEVWKSGDGYTIDLANMNPFIEDLDRGSMLNTAYGISGKSIKSAAKVLEIRLNKQAQRMARRWR